MKLRVTNEPSNGRNGRTDGRTFRTNWNHEILEEWRREKEGKKSGEKGTSDEGEKSKMGQKDLWVCSTNEPDALTASSSTLRVCLRQGCNEFLGRKFDKYQFSISHLERSKMVQEWKINLPILTALPIGPIAGLKVYFVARCSGQLLERVDPKIFKKAGLIFL